MDTKPKEAKNEAKDAGKTKEAVRQLQADVRQLQERVEALSAGRATANGDSPMPSSVSAADVSDEAVAAIGNAFASPQKVALLRALESGGDATAAALGEAAHLSTGSLYHHLRDLSHAGLIAQTERTHYALTPRGVKILGVLLALAAEN